MIVVNIIFIIIQSQDCYTEIETKHSIMINFLLLHRTRKSIIWKIDLYNLNMQMVDGQNDN